MCKLVFITHTYYFKLWRYFLSMIYKKLTSLVTILATLAISRGYHTDQWSSMGIPTLSQWCLIKRHLPSTYLAWTPMTDLNQYQPILSNWTGPYISLVWLPTYCYNSIIFSQYFGEIDFCRRAERGFKLGCGVAHIHITELDPHWFKERLVTPFTNMV